MKVHFFVTIENSDIDAERLEELIADAMDGELEVGGGPIVVGVEDRGRPLLDEVPNGE
jgi:hypothetical protein